MNALSESPPLCVMLVAGEASGDLLAAELAGALRASAGERRIHCFGAGGPEMAAAGVDVAVDLTRHSTIGLVEALAQYRTFKRIFDRLLALAVERRPDAIVCVDFAGFNRRFAHAVRQRLRAQRDPDWRPVIVQYVSPQVWASRPGRARAMARDLDLLLTIFPFERGWYAARVPELRVETVGHPLIDRYGGMPAPAATPPADPASPQDDSRRPPHIVLLPGSRPVELRRHLPAIAGAARLLRHALPDAQFHIVLPNDGLTPMAAEAMDIPGLTVRVGHLAETLATADLAIASTGTVTLECAYFGVPTVALYKTSWATYQIGRRIVTVRYLAMPNLLADEALFPELVQDAATPDRLAGAALDLLRDAQRRAYVKRRLREIVATLGEPGASRRAAEAILGELRSRSRSTRQ